MVARAKRRPDCDVYAWTVRDRLPAIPIPLLAPDPDIVLDLGGVFAMAYERGRYGRLIDYNRPLTHRAQPRGPRLGRGNRARRIRH